MADEDREQLEIAQGVKALPPPDHPVRITAAGTPSGAHRSWTGRNGQMHLRLTLALIRRFREEARAEDLHYNAFFIKIFLHYLATRPTATPRIDPARHR